MAVFTHEDGEELHRLLKKFEDMLWKDPTVKPTEEQEQEAKEARDASFVIQRYLK